MPSAAQCYAKGRGPLARAPGICAAAALDGETPLKLRRSFGFVALTLALAFLFRSCTNMVQTTTPLLARYSLHADTRQVGLLASIFAASVTLPVVTVNNRVPPWHIERTVLASMLLLGATLPLYVAASQFWQLAVLVGMSGFASGIMQPLVLTAVTKYSEPERRERNLALFTVALSAGLLVGPLIETGVLRADGESLAGVFVVFAGVVALAAAISALLARRSAERVGGTWSHAQSSARRSPFARRVRALAGNRPYLLGFVGYLAFNIPYWVVLSFGGIYAHTAFGTPFGTVQLFFAAFFAASLVARLSVVALAPIERKRGALAAALVVAAGGMALLALTHAVALFVLAFALLGVAHGVTYPLAAMLIAGHVPVEELGFANSVFNAATSALGIVVPAVAGGLIASAGYAATFLATGASVTALAALLLAIRLPLGAEDDAGPGEVSLGALDAGAAIPPRGRADT